MIRSEFKETERIKNAKNIHEEMLWDASAFQGGRDSIIEAESYVNFNKEESSVKYRSSGFDEQRKATV